MWDRRDERPGRTGFAHLFEHMLFQGSENVGKGEHFILIQNNGGSANGTTNADRTNYFETLPANQLELAIFLEADRMRAPAINQANFDNQRATVQEERRQNYDNRAYGRTYEAVIDLAYDNFPYKHSTIGSLDDLNAATLDDATAFFRTYYAPNNAVLSMVGSFKTETALWSSLCRDHRDARPPDCPSCRKSIPRSRKWPRQCPECAQVFAGRGWAGIESHWRASHTDVMPYEDFYASLCPAHRGAGDPATGYLPLGER